MRPERESGIATVYPETRNIIATARSRSVSHSSHGVVDGVFEMPTPLKIPKATALLDDLSSI
jgi:hypothetical protein